MPGYGIGIVVTAKAEVGEEQRLTEIAPVAFTGRGLDDVKEGNERYEN